MASNGQIYVSPSDNSPLVLQSHISGREPKLELDFVQPTLMGGICFSGPVGQLVFSGNVLKRSYYPACWDPTVAGGRYTSIASLANRSSKLLFSSPAKRRPPQQFPSISNCSSDGYRSVIPPKPCTHPLHLIFQT